jgi:putative transcriptional regulator
MLRRMAIVGALATVALFAGFPQPVSKPRFHLVRTDLVRSDEPPEAGRLLVATEKLGDPNFREAVILILRHDAEKGTLGLVINRRSQVPLSRIFPDVTGATADPVYVGGPVELSTVQAMLRVTSKSGDMKHILGDVYATSDKDVIQQSISSGADR